MARLVECDGCGKLVRDSADTISRDRIITMRFQSVNNNPDPEADVAGWTADLCRSCLRQVEDPKTWPRAGN